MQTPTSTKARYAAAAIAILVFASLAVQIAINTEPGQSPPQTFGLMMRYFTIWTNFAAGLVAGWTAWRGKADLRVLFALTVAIIIVAAVYHLLLAGEHHPVGLDWWTNLMFHTVIPAAFTLWWFAFGRSSHITWRSLPMVVIFPVAYSAFALLYGAATGFYAYFFLDLAALGWLQLLINMTGLSALFVIVGAILLGLRGTLHRKRAS